MGVSKTPQPHTLRIGHGEKTWCRKPIGEGRLEARMRHVMFVSATVARALLYVKMPRRGGGDLHDGLRVRDCCAPGNADRCGSARCRKLVRRDW